MNPLVSRLSSVYRDELDMYGRVLDLVNAERDALLAGRPLADIIQSLTTKREILHRIEAMERTIAAEKASYQRNKSLFDLGSTCELNETIHTIKKLIQRIMRVEEENERIILCYGEPAAAMNTAATGGDANAGQR